MLNITIKPCPFCGGQAEPRPTHINKKTLMPMENSFYRMFCLDCLVQTDKYEDEQSAVEAWNERVGESDND